VNDLHAKFIELGKDEEKLAEWLNTEVGMYHKKK
jgi:hypothetical protein